MADHRAMIRNVILHLSNEQPLLADLFEPPSPGDVGLRCTNLRMMNGKRPVFVDDSASIFFFPYLHIRFVEIRPGAQPNSETGLITAPVDEADRTAGLATPRPEPEPEADLEIDEEFLRRIREA